MVTLINNNAQPDINSGKKVLLAAPRGYCAGVDRAVIAVEKALDHYGAPVYVRKQIVLRIGRNTAAIQTQIIGMRMPAQQIVG